MALEWDSSTTLSDSSMLQHQRPCGKPVSKNRAGEAKGCVLAMCGALPLSLVPLVALLLWEDHPHAQGKPAIDGVPSRSFGERSALELVPPGLHVLVVDSAVVACRRARVQASAVRKGGAMIDGRQGTVDTRSPT